MEGSPVLCANFTLPLLPSTSSGTLVDPVRGRGEDRDAMGADAEAAEPEERRAEVTRLLRAGAEGREQLFELVYTELRGIAGGRMHGEHAGHTLQATALVHEAWLRLVDHRNVDWLDRGHFFAAASEAMRRILIDHARRAGAEKRGGDRERVTLGALESALEVEPEEAVALAEALMRLEQHDPRAAEVTRLRFFAGLSVEDTARALGLTVRTVHREWTYARARLFEWVRERVEER
jgi:RNA polymerase sigma-70 factor, ECF subfamily